MPTLLNNFEGQADGVAHTEANSGGGSGNKFDNIATGAAAEYDAGIVLEGARSLLIQAGAAQTYHMSWNGTSWAGASEIWARLEGQLSALPTSNMTIMTIREANGTTTGCDVRISTTGQIQLRAPATVRFTSTTALVAGQKFRLEVHVLSSATVGHIEARLWVGANKDSDDIGDGEAFGTWASNYDTGDGTVGGIAFGVASAPGAALNMTVDAVGLTDVDWLGSSAPPAPPPVTLAAYWGIFNRIGAPTPPPTGVGLGSAPLGSSKLGTGV